jgi:predicted outer membrane repeat protein
LALAIFLVLAAGLVASSASPQMRVMQPSPAPQAIKESVRDLLAALLPSANKKTDGQIGKALEHLDRSLEPGLWVDGWHLGAGGATVFDEEQKAVEDLGTIKSPSPGVTAAIAALTGADRQLAQTALDEAVGGNPKELARANGEMAKAAAELGKGHPNLAIDHYGKAWEHAGKAAARPAGSRTFTLGSCEVSELIAAITQANATTVADTIVLEAGCTYTLSAGPYVNGDGPNGLPIVTAPLTIHGNGATIARDTNVAAFRILQTLGFAATDALSLDNVTLRGGSADNGGAVLMKGGTLTITDSTLTGNFALRRGGAIFAEGPWPFGSPELTVPVTVTLAGNTFVRNAVHAPDSVGTDVWGGGAVWAIGDGSLTVQYSTFTGNSSQDNGPGAPYAGALAANTTIVTIAHTTFASNSAPPDGGGGAIYGASPMTISDSTFTNNTDGAIFWEGWDLSTKTLEVTRSTFTNNTHNAISGYRGPNTTTRITDSKFTGNTSPWAGGAIGAMGTTIVTGSTFTGNTAPMGGAIHASTFSDSEPLSLTVTDSTFTDNTSTNPSNQWWMGGGGAINFAGSDPAQGGGSTVRLERDRFEGNSAGGLGGAVSIGAGSFAVVGSTFTSNSAGDDAALGPYGNASNGGAIFSGSSTMSIADSTFTQNAANLGGAVDWEYGGQDPHALTVTGSTFSGNNGLADGLVALMCAYGNNTACIDVVTVANSTFDQDGIWGSRGRLHVTNATLSGGRLSTGGGGPTTITAITLVNTILAGVTCSGPTLDGGGNVAFNSTGCPGIPGDPNLGPLAHNPPGSTQTMALGNPSAAAGAAVGSICMAAVGPPLYGAGGVDQRGVARSAASCDSGAYERTP